MQEQAPLPELFDIHVMSFAGEAAATASALQRLFDIDEELAQRLVHDTPVLVKRAAPAAFASALCDALGKVGAQVVLLPSAASIERASAELPIGTTEDDASSDAWGELALDGPATEELIIPDEVLAAIPDVSTSRVSAPSGDGLAMASSAADFVGDDGNAGGLDLPEIEPLMAPAVREARESLLPRRAQPHQASGPPPPPPAARSRIPPPAPRAPLGLDSTKLPSLPSLGPGAPAARAAAAAPSPQRQSPRPPEPSEGLRQSGTRHLDFGDSQQLPSIELGASVNRRSNAGAETHSATARGSLPDLGMNAQLPPIAGRGSLPDVAEGGSRPNVEGRASLPEPEQARVSQTSARETSRPSLAPEKIRESLAPEGGVSFSGRALVRVLLTLAASLAIFGTGIALDNSILYGNASMVSLALHAIALYLPGAIVLSLVQS